MQARWLHARPQLIHGLADALRRGSRLSLLDLSDAAIDEESAGHVSCPNITDRRADRHEPPIDTLRLSWLGP